MNDRFQHTVVSVQRAPFTRIGLTGSRIVEQEQQPTIGSAFRPAQETPGARLGT